MRWQNSPQISLGDLPTKIIFFTFRLLENQLTYHIESLLKESRSFNANDPLVHLDLEAKKVLDVSQSEAFVFEDFPRSILLEAKRYFKESGVNTLCLVTGIVHLPKKDGFEQTPVILQPVEIVEDKVKNTVKLETQEEDEFLNPYLEFRGAELGLEFKGVSPEKLFSYLSEKGLKVDTKIKAVGNFHHHRYQIIRELEELRAQKSFSPALNQLFGEQKTDDFKIRLSKHALFPSDTDHVHVLNAAQTSNLVIQGPPGTGKSQVLSNLVSRLIDAKMPTIVVSEKRAALEVIQRKLSEYGLDHLTYIATKDHSSKELLQELKSTWQQLEATKDIEGKHAYTADEQRNHLQNILSLINSENLISGVSFKTFYHLRKGADLSKTAFNSDAISIKEFLEREVIFSSIYDAGIAKIVGQLRSTTVQGDSIDTIDQWLEQLTGLLDRLSEVFELNTWKDVQSNMKLAADCQIFENDLYAKYAELFDHNSKGYKKFIRLRNKLNKHLKNDLIAKRSHWKIEPSQAEVESLLNQLKNVGFFSRIKLKKRWNQLSTIPLENAASILQLEQDHIAKKASLSQLYVDFCDLGIDSPEIEVPIIHAAIHSFSSEQWTFFDQLDSSERSKINRHHDDLHKLFSSYRTYFRTEDSLNLKSCLTTLKKSLPKVLELKSVIQQLNENDLKALSRNESLKDLKKESLLYAETKFKQQFSEFAKFDFDQLESLLKKIIAKEGEDAKIFSRQIQVSQRVQFENYHALLSTPARKLNEEDKALKEQLKKGKSILVKEFGKTRSHPSIRELFESEAKIWMHLLKPVWLTNPLQLANYFPMEEGLFGVAIFDEASQIPLQNALGTIQRSKRIIIAGDDQQMGPSSYFKAGSNEVIDLLHQASFHLPNVPLKHHYRSVHPDLISFSNQHFYKGELTAYPSPNLTEVLTTHYCEHGVFDDRRNVEEAKEIAKRIRELIDSKQSLGIVAFSEEQLLAIREQLDPQTLKKVEQRIEEDSLLFKALENVQGDECDILLISFGYGKNTDGDFALRFGPMNTSNGLRRLNVLITRAKQKLELFISVKSYEFGITDNESVNMLKKWIHFMETYVPSREIHFPLELHPEINENELVIKASEENIVNAVELVTLHRVLSQRNWNVKYQ